MTFVSCLAFCHAIKSSKLVIAPPSFLSTLGYFLSALNALPSFKSQRFSLKASPSLSHPVSGELLQKGQRREVTHAVEIDFAVEVIEFMLDHPRVKIVGDELE